ncbi:ABC transporter, ATP-binding protein [Ruminococcus callidus ATCC 27760]|uniref:ABC transporter, ATP-binding protein n=2 Tax=Ruminococcus callidus TaxID=40519 RepID=U2KGQ1_9FIRM|nr:ABC transporter, ATP-binding protein [Ruminococcus callidus ATCC 27760]
MQGRSVLSGTQQKEAITRMIEVKHLTKQYGDKLAVNDISFTVEDGEILGLLGPNGAGKSTTMNMLTGYISSTSGQALINGIDILEDPIKAKAQIGYLPELPPLYLDMTVMGYLNFVYDLKKCKLPRRSHLKDVCNLCRISDVSGRVIKHLSKGYRQRVGLAQALINNPPILILDEPTVGLDPKQIIEIRTLVKKLGKKHTVILSSHILSEVQEVCDRVVIINHGQIAANDTIDNLSKAVSGVNRLVVRISGPKNEVLQAIRAIDDVTKVRADMEREPKIFEFEIEAKPDADIRPALNQMVKEHGWDIYKMDLGVMTLEDAFLKITMGEGVKLSSEKSSAPAAEKSAAPAAETTAPEEPAAAPAEAEKAETPAEDAAQKQEGGEA